jgi:hypothetical protein
MIEMYAASYSLSSVHRERSMTYSDEQLADEFARKKSRSSGDCYQL